MQTERAGRSKGRKAPKRASSPPPAAAKSVRDSGGGRAPAPPPPPRKPPVRRGGAADTWAERGKPAAKPVDPQIVRGMARDTYASKSVPERQAALKQAKGSDNPADAAIVKLHDDRMRSQRYLDRAAEWMKDGASEPADDAVKKGLRILRNLTEERDAVADGLTDSALTFGAGVAGSLHGTGERLRKAPPGPKKGATAGLSLDPGKLIGVARDAKDLLTGPVGMGKFVARKLGANTPVDKAELATLKGSFDATSKVLEQTTRVGSASAGAALAAKHGENPLRGGAEGFLKNDKSYTQLAKELGLKGAPAAVVGTVGDILLDPTTYLTFGAKTPAEAAELAARAKTAAKYRGAVKAAVKAGDEQELAKLAERHDRELESAIAAASRLEGGTRGIQAGVHIPFRGTKATHGKATAAVAKRTTAPVARRVQQSRPVNELLRMFSPAQAPTDVDRLAHREFRHVEREASALESKIARDGRQLGRLIQRATDGDVSKVRAIKDAIEAGTVDQLDDALRAVAERAVKFHDEVASKYEEITGRKLDLLGTVLKKGEVEDALKTARQVLDGAAGKLEREAAGHAADADRLGQRIAIDDAKLGARAAERAALAPGRAAPAESLPQALRKFEHAAVTNKAARTLEDAGELAGRLDDVTAPRSIAEQHDVAQRIVGNLDDVLETARAGVRTNVARGRVNDHLGAVRRGEVDNAELAAALRDADTHAAAVTKAKAAGDRTAARAAESKLRAARATIRRHRDEIHSRFEAELAAEPVKLSGTAGKLEDQIDGLVARLAEDPPVGYVPRKPQVYAEQMLDPGALRKAPLAVRSQAEAGPEMARVDRRREAVIREDPGVPDELKPSDELAVLEAKYGSVMGRRLANLSIYKSVVEKFSAPASTRVLQEAKGSRIFHVDAEGRLTPVPDSGIAEVMAQAEAAEAKAAAEGGQPVYDHIVVPDAVARQLEVREAQHGDRNYYLEKYDQMLRTFKAANTIVRPGFFLTSIVGNTWQGFLADASAADFANAFRVWAHLRSTTAHATKPGGGLMRRIWDAAAPDGPQIVDGRPMSYGDLYEEALEHGAVRTGSRIGDVMELSLEAQASREIAGGAVKHSAEFLNQLAEDVDDVTRMMLYRRARTKLGMSPRQATEYTFSVMIDYGDLTPFERKFMKRVMPFYVYTSRNLPIQVRRLLARPGKLATFEKVRQGLAEAAGLPDGWDALLAEGDQERAPFPVPGLKMAGQQWYQYLRLPVEDISRPLQLLEGPEGASRMVERYGGDFAPFFKAPLELHFNRRFDFDRPISLPGSPPPSGTLERFLGLAESGEHTDLRTGKPYHGASAKLDYLLRSFGGSLGAAALNQGKETADSSGIPAPLRTLISTVGGQGANAPDPLAAVALPQVSDELQKLYEQRDDLGHRPKGRYSEDWYELQDKIAAKKALREVVRAAVGYPDSKAKLPNMRLQRLAKLSRGRQTPHMRAVLHRLQAIENPGG